jgi:hypothetical protein
MSANEIWETRAGFDVIVPDNGAAWGKLGTCKEVADLLNRCAVLQGQTHEASNDVVEADQFRGTVRTFEAKKDFCRRLVIMDAEIKRALTSDPDFLCDMMAAVGEGMPGAHAASTIPLNGISQEGRAALQNPSNPVGDTKLQGVAIRWQN